MEMLRNYLWDLNYKYSYFTWKSYKIFYEDVSYRKKIYETK